MILELIFLISAVVVAALCIIAGVNFSQDHPISGILIIILSLFVAVYAIVQIIQIAG